MPNLYASTCMHLQSMNATLTHTPRGQFLIRLTFALGRFWTTSVCIHKTVFVYTNQGMRHEDHWDAGSAIQIGTLHDYAGGIGKQLKHKYHCNMKTYNILQVSVISSIMLFHFPHHQPLIYPFAIWSRFSEAETITYSVCKEYSKIGVELMLCISDSVSL